MQFRGQAVIGNLAQAGERALGGNGGESVIVCGNGNDMVTYGYQSNGVAAGECFVNTDTGYSYCATASSVVFDNTCEISY